MTSWVRYSIAVYLGLLLAGSMSLPGHSQATATDRSTADESPRWLALPLQDMTVMYQPSPAPLPDWPAQSPPARAVYDTDTTPTGTHAEPQVRPGPRDRR